MRISGNPLQPTGTVIDGIHGCHDGEENLRRADVRRRFISADVLLSGLKCKTVARLTLRIDRNANEATRHFTFKFIRAGHESGVWSTKAEGNAKALAVSDANIGAKLTRSAEDG